jgi:hypothetical protein
MIRPSRDENQASTKAAVLIVHGSTIALAVTDAPTLWR